MLLSPHLLPDQTVELQLDKVEVTQITNQFTKESEYPSLNPVTNRSNITLVEVSNHLNEYSRDISGRACVETYHT